MSCNDYVHLDDLDDDKSNDLDKLVYNTYINLTPIDREPICLDLNEFKQFIENFYGNIPAPNELLNGTLTKEDISSFEDDLCGMYECGTDFQYVCISTENKLDECIKNAAEKFKKEINKDINVLNHYEYCKLGSYFIFTLIMDTHYELIK